ARSEPAVRARVPVLGVRRRRRAGRTRARVVPGPPPGRRAARVSGRGPRRAVPPLGADPARRCGAQLISEAFITCAVTGAGDTTGRSEHIPVTPEQIASSALEAAQAGAAVVHIHVRDPVTGRGARNPALFAEVVSRIRAASSSGVDPVLN